MPYRDAVVEDFGVRHTRSALSPEVSSAATPMGSPLLPMFPPRRDAASASVDATLSYDTSGPNSPGFPPAPSRPSDEEEEDEHVIRVKIVRATGLRAADVGGKSDPFCTCRIRGATAHSITTETLPKTLNPEWSRGDGSFSSDVLGRALEFEVWDSDRFKKADFLGKASMALDSRPCDPGRVFEVEMPLGGSSKARGSLLVTVSGVQPLGEQEEGAAPAPRGGADQDQGTPQRGQENDKTKRSSWWSRAPAVAAQASPEASRLPTAYSLASSAAQAAAPAGPSLTVVGASGLRSADINGLSDPFCTCRLQGDKHLEFQTDVVRKSLNPEWNFWHPLSDSVRGRVLEFDLWDEDRWTKHDYLGKATLAVSQEPCGASQEFDVELPLGGDRRAKGSLKLILRGLRPLSEAPAAHAPPPSAPAAAEAPAPRAARAASTPTSTAMEASWAKASSPGSPSSTPALELFHKDPELLADGQAAKRKLLQAFTDAELTEELERRARLRGGHSPGPPLTKRAWPLPAAGRSPPSPPQRASSPQRAEEAPAAVGPLVGAAADSGRRSIPTSPQLDTRETSPQLARDSSAPPPSPRGWALEVAGSDGNSLRVRILPGADALRGEHHEARWQLAMNTGTRVLGPALRRGAGRAPPLLRCSAEAEACYCQGTGAAAAGAPAAPGLEDALRESFDEFHVDFQAYPTYGDNVVTTGGASRNISHLLHVLGPVSEGCHLVATDSVRRACLFAAYVRVFHRGSQLARWHHGGSASLAVTPLSAGGALTEDEAEAFALATRAYISAFRLCNLHDIFVAIPALDVPADKDERADGPARRQDWVLQRAVVAVKDMTEAEFRRAVAGLLFEGPGVAGPLHLSRIPALRPPCADAGKPGALAAQAPFKYLGLVGREGAELAVLRSESFLHARDCNVSGLVAGMPLSTAEMVPLRAPGSGHLVREVWLSRGGGVQLQEPPPAAPRAEVLRPGSLEDGEEAEEGPSYGAVFSRNSTHEDAALAMFKVALFAGALLSQSLVWCHLSEGAAPQWLAALICFCIVVSNALWVAYATNLVYRKVNSVQTVSDYVFGTGGTWADYRINVGLYLSLVLLQMFDVPASLRDSVSLFHPWRPPRPLCAFAAGSHRAVVVGYTTKKHFEAENRSDGIVQLPRLLFGDLPILVLQVWLLCSSPGWPPCGVQVSVALTAASVAFGVWEIWSHHYEHLALGRALLPSSRGPRPEKRAYIALSREDPNEAE